jgi:hypothetical protein
MIQKGGENKNEFLTIEIHHSPFSQYGYTVPQVIRLGGDVGILWKPPLYQPVGKYRSHTATASFAYEGFRFAK